ncbi:hypothetical protein AgCh_024125 [Apium graveolens]
MNELLIFNPSTRKSREIPSAPAEFPHSSHTTEPWKRIQNVPTNTHLFGDSGMSARGAVHWPAIKSPVKFHEPFVVSFDLGLEQFREVPFPDTKGPIVNFLTSFLYLDGESLFVINHHLNAHSDVWLMNNYSGAENLWSKALTVKQRGILGSFTYFRPVAFPKSGESVLIEFESHEYTESLTQLTKDKLLQRPSEQKPEKKQQKRRDDFLSKGFKLKL